MVSSVHWTRAILSIVTCWTCLHPPSFTALPVDDRIEPYVTHMGEEIMDTDSQDMPRSLNLNFDVRATKVSLNLTRNSNIPCKVPIYLGRDGKIKKINTCTTEDFAVYTDEHNIASILLRPKRMGDGRMKREFTGHFRMGDNEYTLKPVTGKAGRRKKRDAPELPEDAYVITREPIEDELLNFESDGVERASLTASTRFAQELVDYYQPDPLTGTRMYYVETLWVLDYGMFDKWLRRSTADTTSGRELEAIDNIRYYFSHVANGVDLRYRTIRESDYSYRIRLSAFYIAMTPGAAPFSEVNREGGHPIHVEAYDTLDDIEDWLEENKADLPHFDQATMFTGYRLFSRRRDGSRRTIHGLADIRGVCTRFGASVNNDGGPFASTQTAAHEMGHSLGAIHDGINNGCQSRDQFIMAVSPGNLDKRNFNHTYSFSYCSRREFRKHLNFMNMQGTNCLTNEGKSSLQREIDHHLRRPPGQIFSPDDQCRYIKGPESFYCAGQPNDDRLCEVISCYEPDKRKCVTRVVHRAANGTTCGDGKWCMFGRCVEDPRAPAAQDRCLSGDYRAVLYDRSRCQDIVLEPWKCYREDFGGPCCASCENLRVPDRPDCQYGDKSGWCRTIAKSDCYTRSTRQSCCETCAKAETGLKECEYGDKASWCPNIKTSSCYYNARSCCATCAKKREENAGKYSKRCEFGDRASWCSDLRRRPWMCYISGDTCCATCQPVLTGLPGCKYGNRIFECARADCKDRYYQDKCCSTCARELGLTTRRPTTRATTTTRAPTTTTTTRRPTTTTTTTTTRPPPTTYQPPVTNEQSKRGGDCIMQAVDLASWCSKADFFPGNCYDSDHICCVTCATLAANKEVCKYGDKNVWCASVFVGFCYSERTRNECCETCSRNRDESNTDCEYGDRFSWCQREGSGRCHEEDFRHKCCTTCKGYGPRTVPPADPVTTAPTTTTTPTTTDGPKECPDGDQASWCSSIPRSYCYTQDAICCQTCKAYSRPWMPGCEYGDRFTWCPTLSKNRCVEASIRAECCDLCSDFVFNPISPGDPDQANNPVCTTGDKATWCSTIEASNCYLERDRNLCCDACAKFYMGPKGCEFGDRYKDCARDFRAWECYESKVFFDCCHTCSTKHDIGEPGCEFGDKVANCESLDCGDPFVKEKCCKSCEGFNPNTQVVAVTDREETEECTGDQASWCATIEHHHCYGSDKVCCDTCAKFYIGFKGCEYGDKVGWCQRQIKTAADCNREDVGGYCCKTCTLIGNPSTRESPEEWKEGVIISFLNKDMSRAIEEESDMLVFLSHQVNEYCMDHTSHCCSMLYRAKGNRNSALTVSPVSEEPPYEDEGEDDVLGRRRPTVRLVTPRHTQVAGGYPRYSNQNEGEIITKYIVRIPVAGLEELCNVRPLAVDSPPPGHRSRRQAEAGGSGKAVIYFDKYTLHQVVVDNMNIIETALGVRISGVDVAGVRTQSRMPAIIGIAVGAVSAVTIVLALLGLAVWKLHRSLGRKEEEKEECDVRDDLYRPNPVPTSRRHRNKIEHWDKAAGSLSSLPPGSLATDVYVANQFLPGVAYVASSDGKLTVLTPGVEGACSEASSAPPPASPPPPYHPKKGRPADLNMSYAWVSEAHGRRASSDEEERVYVDART